MKTIISFGVFFLFQICFAQNKLPNDLIFIDLKGNVKSVEEIVSKPEIHDIKKIYNFDKNGLLSTVLEYSEYLIDKDSLVLNNIYNYKNSNDERTFTVQNLKTKKITSTGIYQLLKPNIYSLKVKLDNGMTSLSEMEFNNNLIISTKNVVTDENEIPLTDINMQYNYIDEMLTTIVFTTSVSKTKDIATVKTTKIDEHGNFKNQKFFDKSNKLVHEIKRKITYYD